MTDPTSEDAGPCGNAFGMSADEGPPDVLDDALHGSASSTSADGACPDSRAMQEPSPGMLRLFGSETSKSSGRPPVVLSPSGASPASAKRSKSTEESDSDDEEKNPYIKGNVTPPPRADAPSLFLTDFNHKIVKKSPFQAMRWSTPELWNERSRQSLSHSSVRSFKFDSLWKSQTVRLSSDQTSVMYCHSGYGGFVTSEVPLRKRAFGRFFEIRIEDSNVERWNDGFAIGLVRRPLPNNPLAGGKHDPTPRTPPHLQPEVLRRTRLGLDLPGAFDPARPFEAGVGYACEVMAESWMLGYDGRAKLKGVSRHFRGESELPAGPWRPSDLAAGDVVGLLATPESQLMLFINDQLRVCVSVPDLPGRAPLHVALDVDGCTRSIHLLDSDGEPSKKILDESKRFKQEHVPQKQAERWQNSIRYFRDQRAQGTGDARGKIHPQDSFEAHMRSGTIDMYFRQAGFSYDPATKTKFRPADFTSSTQTQRNIARMRDTFPSVATRRAMSSPQSLRSSASSTVRSSQDAFHDMPSRRYPGLVAMLDS